MKKIEFLKLAFQNKRYQEKNWCVRILSEFSEKPGAPLPKKPYTPIRDSWGISITLPTGDPVRLEDHTSGPLFKMSDVIEVDSSWLGNIKESMTTRFGILLANALLIHHAYGDKIPFINGEVSISKVESIVAPRLTSDPPEGQEPVISEQAMSLGGPIFVHEYLKMGQGIEFIASIMELFTIALTEKSILPPTGIKEFKEKLNKEYEGRLHDPIVMAEYEEKLKAFDAAYLKDDPSFGKFTSGKVLNDSRKKLFLSMGAEGGFSKDGSITPITNSLTDGYPDDPDKYVAVINGFRAGSFSRGAETVEGGVAAKKMLAAANNYVIRPGDCGSTLGLRRYYTKALAPTLQGRTVIIGKEQIKVPLGGDTSPYLGQVIAARSPMFCKLPGENICATCAGEAMARYETGIALPLTEISAAILAARMKAMHTNSLKVNDFDLNTLFT